MALFGYLGIQYSKKSSDVTSTKEVHIFYPGLKNLLFLLSESSFFAFFERKTHRGEVRI